MYSHNHKTVFILDHSSSFAESCKEVFDFDFFSKASRNHAVIPLSPVCKSHWTSAVEAAMEICRVVYDIFGEDKLISFIASDTEAHVLNGWTKEEQNTSHLMSALALLGAPAPVGPPSSGHTKDGSAIAHGLRAAAHRLCEPTPAQHRVRHELLEDADKLQNNGRIICLTSLRSDKHAANVIEAVHHCLIEENKAAVGYEELLPVHSCDLLLVHVHPADVPSKITPVKKHTISPLLSATVIPCESGKKLANRLLAATMDHYNLVITSVTGIPMKEEQNASSSANYDVELLHSAEAHKDVLSDCADGVKAASKEVAGVDSVTLRWCTPKMNAVELQHCIGAFRLSPVDVNSRPSLCLTNFLLGGRAVMLEQPRKSGSRVLSHMLACHGGDIYVHVLSAGSARTVLEDPPSISEGCGGRVTDYRIQDFGELMKENRLAPTKQDYNGMLPIEKAEAQLERMTRCWPMVINETLIFNMLSHIDPLPSLIVKEQLDEEELLECKKAIYHLVSLESDGGPLLTNATTTSGASGSTSSSGASGGAGTRSKGTKREEQYRQMWNELETLLRAHADTSSAHQQVLGCLLDCRKPLGGAGSTGLDEGRGTKRTRDERGSVSLGSTSSNLTAGASSMRADSENSNCSRNGAPSTGSGASGSEPTSRASSPVLKKPKMDLAHDIRAGSQTLLQLWTNHVNAINSKRHEEFAGRIASGGSNRAQLYASLGDKGEKVDEKSEAFRSCADF